MQGRRAASSEHLTSAPSRAERPAPVSESPALQSHIGNRAMVSILSQRRPAQGDQGSSSLLPADVNVGFNPMDIRNRLLEAIDQSEVRLTGVQADMTGLDLWRRHIDYPKVVAVLSNLTAGQVREVEKAYKDHEAHSMGRHRGRRRVPSSQ
jgi:hypothetical protein